MTRAWTLLLVTVLFAACTGREGDDERNEFVPGVVPVPSVTSGSASPSPTTTIDPDPTPVGPLPAPTPDDWKPLPAPTPGEPISPQLITPDVELGADGILDSGLPFDVSSIFAVRPSEEGLLVLASHAAPPYPSVLARLDSDGMLDTAFGGGDGFIDVSACPSRDFEIDEEGRIFLASTVWGTSGAEDWDPVVCRYLPSDAQDDGALDAAPSTNGVVQAFIHPRPDGRALGIGVVRGRLVAFEIRL